MAAAYVPGLALADQVKSLDWQARQAERKGNATATEIEGIKARGKSPLRLG